MKMDLKGISLSEKAHLEKLYIIWFHLMNILKMTKL